MLCQGILVMRLRREFEHAGTSSHSDLADFRHHQSQSVLRRFPRLFNRLGNRFAPDLPVYMQISRRGLVLHLSEHHGDACPGSSVFVQVEGIEVYHHDLLAKKCPTTDLASKRHHGIQSAWK